jgi:ubiquinone/menaquinone biosynthesis C-methylase UbiE
VPRRAPSSVYDPIAPEFDRRRALPDGVPEAIRDAVLRTGLPPRPRLLDLGAGSGRIGRAFVQAGDDYTAVDRSFVMLRTFAGRLPAARLAQADGACLPFDDAAFDAVLLVQVLSGVPGWCHFLTETLRVLRPSGTLIAGCVVAPDAGIDARMKTRLAEILAGMDIHPYRDKPRDDAMAWLARSLPAPIVLTAAAWLAERTPRGFLERHSRGARFSLLPEPVKQEALRRLAAWAAEQCGDLDAVRAENYRFELTIHRLPLPECPTQSQTPC